MEKILVTGGLGFIGSNFIKNILLKDNLIVNIDSKTYASVDLKYLNFDSNKNYKYLDVNICDFNKINQIIKEYSFDKIFHFAAESHVDNSINNPFLFAKTNVLGTINLLESYKNISKKKKLFIHVSTDEVYGSIRDGKFNENSPYKPNSSYSASKASSDHFVNSYKKTHGLPVMITHCSNNFGPYQNKEKLIPKVIKCLINRSKIPIYGKGKNIREWIYVDDHVNALDYVSKYGKIGDTYCIGSNYEISNIELVEKICTIFDKLTSNKNSKKLIHYVDDRKGHDFRYSLETKKINNLGWFCKNDFEDSLLKTINWYLKNKKFLI